VKHMRVGRLFGLDLHRRRSVIVRMTESGERLETVCILNNRDRLAEVRARAGECPEKVVLEATYGWYWSGGCVGRAWGEGAFGAPVGGECLLRFPRRMQRNPEQVFVELSTSEYSCHY
jgi:hypothetical protein